MICSLVFKKYIIEKPARFIWLQVQMPFVPGDGTTIKVDENQSYEIVNPVYDRADGKFIVVLDSIPLADVPQHLNHGWNKDYE